MKTDDNAVIDGLNATLAILRKAGKRAVFVVDNPTLPDPKTCMDRSIERFGAMRWLAARGRTESWDDRCSVPLARHLSETAQYRELVKKLASANPDLIVFDPTPYLCNMSEGVCPIAKNGQFLYSYADHVSDYGSSLFVPAMLKMIDKNLGR
jgi:hypothetical protein